MAIKTIITCDQCGVSNANLKGNHWLCMTGGVFTEITIRRREVVSTRTGLDWKDYCGEACLHKALSTLFERRTAEGGPHE